MTQSLRRELRKSFEEKGKKTYLFQLADSSHKMKKEEWDKVCDEFWCLMADAALEVSAIAKRAEIAQTSIEAAIWSGLPVSDITPAENLLQQEATNAFEAAWHITRPWDWWKPGKEWRDLREFVVKVYQEDNKHFERYVAWWTYRGKFEGGKSAPMIQRDPACFYAAWDMFKMQDKQVSQERKPGQGFFA